MKKRLSVYEKNNWPAVLEQFFPDAVDGLNEAGADFKEVRKNYQVSMCTATLRYWIKNATTCLPLRWVPHSVSRQCTRVESDRALIPREVQTSIAFLESVQNTPSFDEAAFNQAITTIHNWLETHLFSHFPADSQETWQSDGWTTKQVIYLGSSYGRPFTVP